MLLAAYYSPPTAGRLAAGYWPSATGRLVLAADSWPDTPGGRLVPPSYWPYATGRLLLVACSWPPAGQPLRHCHIRNYQLQLWPGSLGIDLSRIASQSMRRTPSFSRRDGRLASKIGLAPCTHSECRPMVAQTGRHPVGIARMWTNPVRIRPTWDRDRPNSTDSGPNAPESGTHSINIGQVARESAKFGPTSTDVALNSTNFD